MSELRNVVSNHVFIAINSSVKDPITISLYNYVKTSVSSNIWHNSSGIVFNSIRRSLLENVWLIGWKILRGETS